MLQLFSLCVGSILLIQDADIDDYTCTIILSVFKDFEGEVLINADSTAPANMEAASKLHKLLPYEISLSLSRVRMYNAFPYEYRKDAVVYLGLPELVPLPSTVSWPFEDGDRWLEEYLKVHTNVTLVITAAPTPLTEILKRNRQLAKSIRKVLMMGGAVDVPGNLNPQQFPWNNTKAEWNIYADPFASADLFSFADDFEIILFPLDISNQAPINNYFFSSLQEAVATSPPNTTEHTIHELMLSAYSYVRNNTLYRLWDAVAAGYTRWPELYSPAVPTLLEVVTVPPNMGWTRRCAAPSPTCATVYVVGSFVNDTCRDKFLTNVAQS